MNIPLIHYARMLADYLTDDEPESRRQALLGQGFVSVRRLIRNPIAAFGLAVVFLLLFTALFAPRLTRYSPIEQDLLQRLQPPSEVHWFGTDEYGRDILSRIVFGARITLTIVLLVAAIAAPIGLIVGTVAGYMGGWIDKVLMRFTDIFMALPSLILALAFVAALGPGIINSVIAISFTIWAPYARIARAETLTIRNAEYILAVRVQGASAFRVVTRHIMPICLSSIIVRVTLDMAGIILIAAGLGFLGLGAQPPEPEWGAMISTGRKYIFSQWWLATFPGLAIFIVSLGFNLLGDGLRDMLDRRI